MGARPKRFAAVLGTTIHETSAYRTVTGTNQATATTISGSGVWGMRATSASADKAHKPPPAALDEKRTSADSPPECSPFASQISGQGMDFVARCYSDNAAKALTAAEVQALSGAGVKIIAILEDTNNSAAFFSTDIGKSHAAKALQIAAAVGQPVGTAIYFAVDYDASPAEVQGPVTDYFRAIKDVFAPAATQYAIGVYGSGMTCRVMAGWRSGEIYLDHRLDRIR